MSDLDLDNIFDDDLENDNSVYDEYDEYDEYFKLEHGGDRKSKGIAQSEPSLSTAGFNLVAWALKLKGIFSKEAKEKQKEGGGAVRQKSAQPEMKVRDKLAEKAGVSEEKEKGGVTLTPPF